MTSPIVETASAPDTSPIPGTWLGEPFRMGSVGEFAAIRELFHRADFSGEAVARVGGGATTADILKAQRGEGSIDVRDGSSLLVQLFIMGRPVSRDTIDALLGPGAIDTLDALALLVPARDGSRSVEATIALYPIEGIWAASDRHGGFHASPGSPPSDIVYSALTEETYRFLSLMPRKPCDDFLELCAGSGAAALLAASTFARRAVATDITHRSTRFATFGAALNGLTHVEALDSDVYDALQGRTFDLIVGHPPYMPSFETELIYRDAGLDGEQVTRRMVEQLPTYLRPGGEFHGDCMMSDRASGSIQDRIRTMLGEHSDDFDLLVGEIRSFEPRQYYGAQVQRGVLAAEVASRRFAAFDQLGIERFALVAFFLRRAAVGRRPATTRRLISAQTARDDVDWGLGWIAALADRGGDDSRFLDVRPRALPAVELRSRSLLGADGWAAVECRLATTLPFAAEANCDPWLAELVASCDGTVTVREHFGRLLGGGLIPPDAPILTFATMIRQLADGGFLELEEFPLPDVTAGRSPSPNSATPAEIRPR